MKLKPLFTVIIVLAGVAAVASWWRSSSCCSIKSGETSLVGKKLLDPDLLQQATQFEFKKSEDTVPLILQKSEGDRWILPDHYGLPVDFSKLNGVTESLLDGSVERLVTSSPDRIQRLELGKSKIILKKADGQTLWELETGTSGSTGGTFIRLNQGKEAYLTSADIHLDTNKENWSSKKLLDFKVDDVSELTLAFEKKNKPFQVVRKEKSQDFSTDGLKENQKVKQAEVTRVLNHLINAQFTKVEKPDDIGVKAAKNNARTITIKLFNGNEYTLNIGKASKTAGKDTKNKKGKDETPKPEESKPVFVFYQSSDAKDVWNEVMKKAALSYPDTIYDQLPTSQDALIEAVPPQPSSTPETKPEIKSAVKPAAKPPAKPEPKKISQEKAKSPKKN